MKEENFCFLGGLIHYKSNKRVKNKYCLKDIKFRNYNGSLTMSLDDSVSKHKRMYNTFYYFDYKSIERFVRDYPFITINEILYKTKALVSLQVVHLEVV